MTDFIYIHLDNFSNSVMSNGLTNIEFSHSVMKKPQNLLILDPQAEEGEYEPHTALKVIRGEDQVSRYFSILSKKKNPSIKWIDFNDVEVLKQLTPMEISELLYFGHMKMQLHSPFFYKLQNNYVFFEMPEKMTKVYYRHLEEFYRILGDKITRVLMEKLNDRKTFFKRSVAVDYISDELMRELKPILQEGVVFSFAQSEAINKKYTIPIYVVEDRVRRLEEQKYTPDMQIASLIYDTSKRSWSIEKKEWEVIPYPKQA